LKNYKKQAKNAVFQAFFRWEKNVWHRHEIFKEKGLSTASSAEMVPKCEQLYGQKASKVLPYTLF